jgi:glutaredoxin-related protein
MIKVGQIRLTESILRMHAHDLDLKPSLTVYKRWTKGSPPSCGFQRQATTILKTLTLVTSFLHVKALLEQE